MGRRNVLGVVAALAVLVAGATACEPPPPRTTFVVDASGSEPDADPGDGACATAADTCTFAAAIDEANALGTAAITVPGGDYDLGEVTITGTVFVNDRSPALGVRVAGAVTVAPGGALVLDGALSDLSSGSSASGPLTFRVEGLLTLRNVQVGWAGASVSLVHVAPTGLALLDTTFLGASFPRASVVRNEGRLFLRHSWLMDIVPDPGVAALETTGAGVTTTHTSIIAPVSVAAFPGLPFTGCLGTAPVSRGHNAFGDDSCSLTATSDRRVGPIASSLSAPVTPFDYRLDPGSPLVDAIPLGVQGCGSEPWGDWVGQPRPAEGDGVAPLACDIGPKERQAGAAGSDRRAAPSTTPPWGLGS